MTDEEIEAELAPRIDAANAAEPVPKSWGTPYTRLMDAEATLRSLLPHTARNNAAHTSLRRALEDVSDVGEYLLRQEAKLQELREARQQTGLAVPEGKWLVSIKDASQLLGISTSTIRSDYLYGDWKLFTVRIGRRYLIRVDGLKEWLDRLTKEQHPEPTPPVVPPRRTRTRR